MAVDRRGLLKGACNIVTNAMFNATNAARALFADPDSTDRKLDMLADLDRLEAAIQKIRNLLEQGEGNT